MTKHQKKTVGVAIASLVLGLLIAGCEDTEEKSGGHLPDASAYGVASGSAALVIRNDSPNHTLKSVWAYHEGSDGPVYMPDISAGQQYVHAFSPGNCSVSFRSWSGGYVQVGARYKSKSFKLIKNKAVIAVHSGSGSAGDPTRLTVED